MTRLRGIFLDESTAASPDYWSAAVLEDYDRTFGARIGWKWDAVLQDAKARGWAPPAGAALLDWGCGTGIATRRFLAAFGEAEVVLSDRSRAAVGFAAGRIAAEFPGARVVAEPGESYVLLASHVLGELSGDGERRLDGLAQKAAAIVWVEPGTPALGRRLVERRERWRDRFAPVAPCPHRERCGLVAPQNARHWCHHFAEPAPEAFTTAEWAEFSRRLKIDLRSLPTSYLVLDRRGVATGPDARVIGRPRVHTGYATYLRCDAEGVREARVLRKDDKEKYRAFEGNEFARYE